MDLSETYLDEVRHYYDDKIEQHGATPRGVDWRDHASQEARFEQLALVMESDRAASVADIGCGYGALAGFLRARGWQGHYEGVDISPAMIAVARERLPEDENVTLTLGRCASKSADFVIASGIFNVKGSADSASWESYVFAIIDDLVASARRGVALNFLSSWSDEPLMRSDLYYATPERVFAYCAAKHSRWQELSQDYGLFEFTLRMRLDRSAPSLRAVSPE